jgi:hypothetical protein
MSFVEFDSIKESFSPDHDGANEVKKGLKNNFLQTGGLLEEIREKESPKEEANEEFKGSSHFSKNIHKLPSLSGVVGVFNKIHEREIDCTEKESPEGEISKEIIELGNIDSSPYQNQDMEGHKDISEYCVNFRGCEVAMTKLIDWIWSPKIFPCLIPTIWRSYGSDRVLRLNRVGEI